MDADQAIRTVDDILKTEFEVEPSALTPTARLREELGLDSLDAVDFIVAVEKALHLHIAEEQARELRTVGDVHRYVRGAVGPGLAP